MVFYMIKILLIITLTNKKNVKKNLKEEEKCEQKDDKIKKNVEIGVWRGEQEKGKLVGSGEEEG